MALAFSKNRVPGRHKAKEIPHTTMSETKTPVVLDEDEIAALKAQTKHNEAIADYHVEILKRIQRLEKLGGEQDYSVTILKVLEAFGGSVNLSFLAPVIPDHALLTKARERLSKEGLITETTIKNRKILHLVKAA